VRATKRPKKKYKEKPKSGKLGIHRNHPRLQIELKFCVVGGLHELVLRFKFRHNRLSAVSELWGSKFTTAQTVNNSIHTIQFRTRQTESRQKEYKKCTRAGLVYSSTLFWATVCKTARPFVKPFALCYRTIVCPVLSVTLVYCGQTVGWIKIKLGVQVEMLKTCFCS